MFALAVHVHGLPISKEEQLSFWNETRREDARKECILGWWFSSYWTNKNTPYLSIVRCTSAGPIVEELEKPPCVPIGQDFPKRQLYGSSMHEETWFFLYQMVDIFILSFSWHSTIVCLHYFWCCRRWVSIKFARFSWGSS